MSEQLYLYFQKSDHIIPLEKMRAGRKKNPSRNVDFDLSEYFSGDLTRISRKHFVIHEEKGQFFIEDLGSTNGTEVDGQVLVRRQWRKIENGNEIILASREHFLIEVIDEIRRQEILDGETIVGKGTKVTASEDRQQFYLNGKEVPLTETQQALMQYLYRNTGTTCSFHEIRREVWFGRASRNVITQTIRKIRQRLDKIDMGAGENHIKGIRGEGYQLIRKYTE